MLISLRRFLIQQGIQVYYDDDWNPIETLGCNDDFSIIAKFCKEILDEPRALGEILSCVESDGVYIICDCEYLTKYSGDFFITNAGELPLNPN